MTTPPQCKECVRLRRLVRNTLMLCAVLCASLLANLICTSYVVNSAERLVHSMQKMVEAQRAQSFGSGFLYGQRSTIKHAGLPMGMPPVHEFSKEDRANASKYGFDSADDDPER